MHETKIQSRDAILQAIAPMPLAQSGGTELINSLAAEAKILHLKKRSPIATFGDRAQRFFLIRSGWVKLFRETLDGTEAIIDILTTDHFFGETALFENNLYPFSAEATEPVTLLSLPLAPVAAELEHNSKFALAMIQTMARYRRHQDMELEHRTIQTAPQRIGCFLLRLADQSKDGDVTVQLPYDKVLVASRLGMKPETFSRALGKLKADTGIKVDGATIHVTNLGILSSYACTACSGEYPCGDKIHPFL